MRKQKYTPSERQFEIIKFLHKPRTMDEIKKEFELNKSTASHMFTDGKFRFLNVEFPFYKRKIRGKGKFLSDSRTNDMIQSNDFKYKSTVNPIVLPLNLTEVYALTNHILDITYGSEDYRIYKEIADKIYSQLSDYARAQIGNREHYLTVSDTVEFTSEEDMFAEYFNGILMYCLKAMEKAEITLKNNDKIIGKVIMIDNDYAIETEDKKIKVKDIKNIRYIGLANKSGK